MKINHHGQKVKTVKGKGGLHSTDKVHVPTCIICVYLEETETKNKRISVTSYKSNVHIKMQEHAYVCFSIKRRPGTKGSIEC